MGAAGDGDSERKKKGKIFLLISPAITAVLAFNRRGSSSEEAASGRGRLDVKG